MSDNSQAGGSGGNGPGKINWTRRGLQLAGLLATIIVFYVVVMRLCWDRRMGELNGVQAALWKLTLLAALCFVVWVPFWFLGRLARRWAWLGRRTQWARSRRGISLSVFGAAALATLVALGYAVENARGKSAWEKKRQELAAKGEVIDWKAMVPGPVPDEQNIFKAPKMKEWFIRNSTGGGPPASPAGMHMANPCTNAQAKPVVVAEIHLGGEATGDELVVHPNDTEAQAKLARALWEAVGPGLEGPTYTTLIKRTPDEIKPVRLRIPSDSPLNAAELGRLFPSNIVALAAATASRFHVRQPSNSVCQVTLDSAPWTAANYLECTAGQEADFDVIRAALKRPAARRDGDFEQPYLIPIVNFVTLRTVAQALAQRAQAHLLTGQPEAALKDLTLLHDLGRFLQDKPVTLVAAMIHVAITGLYTSVIGDGIRLHAWREPELAALERQLSETDLAAGFVEAFRAERAATSYTFENTPPGEYRKLFGHGNKPGDLLDLIKDGWGLLFLAPRGWIYQNMVIGATANQKLIESVDMVHRTIDPAAVDKEMTETLNRFGKKTPYTWLAAIAVPNFQKAAQTFARNQSLVNLGVVACALERYWLKEHVYPESLDALVPRYLAAVPHDWIGGGALHYRRVRNGDGEFVLYSVGWDQKDDGGTVAKTLTSPGAAGDWVWK